MAQQASCCRFFRSVQKNSVVISSSHASNRFFCLHHVCRAGHHRGSPCWLDALPAGRLQCRHRFRRRALHPGLCESPQAKGVERGAESAFFQARLPLSASGVPTNTSAFFLVRFLYFFLTRFSSDALWCSGGFSLPSW